MSWLTVYEHHSGLHQLVEDKAALPTTALRVVSMATLKIAIWVERGAYLKPSSYFYVCSGVSIGLASNPQHLILSRKEQTQVRYNRVWFLIEGAPQHFP
jgi:hypothetical protein